MQSWHQQLPIYQQLADQLAARLLDGELSEGAPMPSVRALASRYLLNPLTVSRAGPPAAPEPSNAPGCGRRRSCPGSGRAGAVNFR